LLSHFAQLNLVTASTLFDGAHHLGVLAELMLQKLVGFSQFTNVLALALKLRIKFVKLLGLNIRFSQ
jgi:hypothetical protein